MSDPIKPFAKTVEKGKLYPWCTCGNSQNKPFCDGSHKGSEFKPVRYIAEKDGTLYFCACGKTGSQPLCDGSHKNLT